VTLEARGRRGKLVEVITIPDNTPVVAQEESEKGSSYADDCRHPLVDTHSGSSLEHEFSVPPEGTHTSPDAAPDAPRSLDTPPGIRLMPDLGPGSIDAFVAPTAS